MRSKLAELSLWALVAAATACREEHFTSPIDLSIPIVGNGAVCLGMDGVDTFELDVFRVEGTPTRATTRNTVCSLCGIDPALTCTRISSSCRCGSSRNLPREIDAALRGARIADLPNDVPLCARLVLADRGLGIDGASGAAASDCACASTEERVASARLCALTDLFTLSPAEAPIDLAQYVCRERDEDGGTLCTALAARCAARLPGACDELARVCDRAPSSLATCAGFD